MGLMSIRNRIVQYLQRGEQRPRPDDWDSFWYSKPAYDNSTGQIVTEDLALRYATVWACVKVISEDIASLPLVIYRREGKSKERAIDSDLYYLLHDAPNDEMTAMQFREALQGHLLTWGNAYAQIIRNQRGEPKQLWPLNPGQIKLTRTESGELLYKYRKTDSGAEVLFDKSEVLHVGGLGFNGITGYSPIQYQCEVIGTALAGQRIQGW
jgi:HK97 family phage portal protein